jgi:hypothetical protein
MVASSSEIICSFGQRCMIIFSFSHNQLLAHLKWHLGITINDILFIYSYIMVQQISFFSYTDT